MVRNMIRIRGIAAVLAFGFLCACGANTPIPKPTCDSTKNITVRYSSTSQRIYLESVDGSRGGCTDPRSIYEALGPTSPLYPLETPGEWMLAESLYVSDGIVFKVYGTGAGGECDYLKLRSDADTVVNLRAHGGSLDFMNTKVTSWDPSKASVDEDWGDGRSYISAISEVVLDAAETCQGVAKNEMGEARMDIENCEIAYLGYEASESWGISWKLRGICNDKSNRDKYDGVGVYGNLLNSDIHHLWYGHYGYAQLYSLMSGNSVHDNEVYGFDPHDDSINVTISQNEVYNNFHHGIIFSKYCHNTIVTANYVHDNGGVGIFPHYVSDNAVVAHNTIEKNGDSGIAFLESSGGFVYNNTVRQNVHGIRFSVGSRDNVVANNAFEDNEGYDVYQYAGTDPVVEVETVNPTRNVFFENKFAGNTGGARLDDSVDTQFVSNNIQDWPDFEFRDSDDTLILGNTFPNGMTYSLSNSCLNSASDVDGVGIFCTGAAITDPFDQTDFGRMIGGQNVPEIQATPAATTAATQTPSDSQVQTSAQWATSSSSSSSGSRDGSVSPTGLFMTASPTAATVSVAPTPASRDVGVLPSTSSSSAEGHVVGGGGSSSIDTSGGGEGGGGGGCGDGGDGGDAGDGGEARDGGESDVEEQYTQTMSPSVSPGMSVSPTPGDARGIPVSDDDGVVEGAINGDSGDGGSRTMHVVVGGITLLACNLCGAA